jgi:D-glycero-alpha-D-manno-heptose-7-phosphate kinase
MIISRTPFRISFFGGGTDYPVWFNENDGAVLSVTIDKYCYITCRYLPPFFDYKHRLVYSQREEVDQIDQIDHPSVRECLRFIGLDNGVEIHHDGDLPARTGLGSSSSFTVGLLNALYALKGVMVSKKQLAFDAIHVEQDMIKENVGSQDQMIASFGGLNKISFSKNNNIQVQPITIDSRRLELFQSHLMLFFTGFSRKASDIACEQIKQTPQRKNELKRIHETVEEAINILNDDRTDIEKMGELLDESWKIKRMLTDKISTPEIDQIYEAAKSAGAVGGKLLGAGGGGFVLLFAHYKQQQKIRDKLKHLLHVPFRFDNTGSQIVYYSPEINIQ